jgi:membrane protease YdiL (CAAX protease family)
VVLSIAVVSVLCAVFLLGGWTLPDWVVLVGRWIPALASLVVLRVFPLPGGIGYWWALRPGGWRRLLIGGVVAVGLLLVTYALTVLMAGVTGLAAPLPWSQIAPILLLIVPLIVVFSVSTFGEEVAWRGHLQQLLAGRGFWTASTAVAGVWVLFHIPLHGTFALQGTLPAHVLVGSTLLLFPLGLFLSAAVHRFGSIWPAVFAHALPMSALNLVQDPDGLAAGSFWVFTALSAAALAAAAALLAPRAARTALKPSATTTV